MIARTQHTFTAVLAVLIVLAPCASAQNSPWPEPAWEEEREQQADAWGRSGPQGDVDPWGVSDPCGVSDPWGLEERGSRAWGSGEVPGRFNDNPVSSDDADTPSWGGPEMMAQNECEACRSEGGVCCRKKNGNFKCRNDSSGKGCRGNEVDVPLNGLIVLLLAGMALGMYATARTERLADSRSQ